MKKTIKKQDGSEEVIEGSAEEIADYEKKMRGEVREAPKPVGPGLLTDEVKRFLETLRDTQQPYVSVPSVFASHQPWCAAFTSPWFGITPPPCNCGAGIYKTQITLTTTSGTLDMSNPNTVIKFDGN